MSDVRQYQGIAARRPSLAKNTRPDGFVLELRARPEPLVEADAERPRQKRLSRKHRRRQRILANAKILPARMPAEADQAASEPSAAGRAQDVRAATLSENKVDESVFLYYVALQIRMKQIIIAITNQKGGEGKTTTAINMAVGLADKGYRTLLVDMDPQANTTGIFSNPDRLDKSLYDVFMKKVPIKDVVIPTSRANLQLAPSKITLAEVESFGGNVDAPYILRDALQAYKEFDYAVIDCPPALSIFTVNALVAATHVVIPAQPEKFSIDGMSGLRNTINSIQRRINPDLIIAGALVTQLKPKTVLTKTILPVISQFFTVFHTTISEGVAVGESHLAKKSIFEYAPDSKQAKEYSDFLEELLIELKA